MQQKIKKKFFVSEIIAFELVSLKCLYFKNKILFIVTQCVNKLSQDLACQ